MIEAYIALNFVKEYIEKLILIFMGETWESEV